MSLRDERCDECMGELTDEHIVLLKVGRCGWTGTFHVRCCGASAMRALLTCDTRHEKSLAIEALQAYLDVKRQELSDAAPLEAWAL